MARFRPIISSMSTRRASRRWRAAGMVAVLLPGAFYALKETRKPPVELLRRYGVPMAVATDCNPGTSPVLSPTLMMAMACTLFGLTPEEALAGMTRDGARALGLQDEIGTISAGKAADLCVWRIGRPAELCYWIGLRRPRDAGSWPARICLNRRRAMHSRRDNSRHIAAPTGTELSCKSWTTEAAMRMLMNNLDPQVAEAPEELVVYGGIGRAARDWESYDSDRRDAAAAGGRRDPARPVGQAGRRVPHPRGCAARADRQFEPGAALGDLGPFQRIGSQGADDVRPDDGRIVDLHRHPGHRSGHLRDLRRNGPPAL